MSICMLYINTCIIKWTDGDMLNILSDLECLYTVYFGYGAIILYYFNNLVLFLLKLDNQQVQLEMCHVLRIQWSQIEQVKVNVLIAEDSLYVVRGNIPNTRYTFQL